MEKKEKKNELGNNINLRVNSSKVISSRLKFRTLVFRYFAIVDVPRDEIKKILEIAWRWRVERKANGTTLALLQPVGAARLKLTHSLGSAEQSQYYDIVCYE